MSPYGVLRVVFVLVLVFTCVAMLISRGRSGG